MTSVAAGVPTIRNGNTEPPPHARSENHLEPALEERRRHEQATTVKSQQNPRMGKKAPSIRQPYEEDIPTVIKSKRPSKAILNKREVTEFIRVFHQPPIQSRHSSLALRKTADKAPQPVAFTTAVDLESNRVRTNVSSEGSLQTSSLRTLSTSRESISEVDCSTPQGFRRHGPANVPNPEKFYELKDTNESAEGLPKRHISDGRLQDKLKHLKHDKLSHLHLRGKSHISLRDHKGFSLSRSHRRRPIARDWSPSRKRFAASVACISTALIGILVGIYAGEVPSIQYYIADFYHYAILGNVFFFITLAITTFLFWPLPLLHGRKPYILAALTLAMPLLFPQAISVSMQRSPYVATWRILLILPRTLMGAALGFANMNFMATLTDLFGASLQSGNPHQETVDEYDVRRHGGGLGVWLGIWTWCYIGSIGVGFLVGALVINTLSPDWGFYVSIVIIAAVLLLNVVTPEVRRSAYRRSVAEVRTVKDISRRLARGEIMMHRVQTGPKWWGQEFYQGVMLSLDMMRQPGFLVMSFYVAWIYGQIVLVIAVCSRISILRP
jgi:MFS family permease